MQRSFLCRFVVLVGVGICCALVNSTVSQPTCAMAAEPDDDGPPPYRKKTAAQWIEVLAKSPDANARAKAAEAIGFMARESTLTYGGFSDVPIDSEPPPKLSDTSLEPMVAALTTGLSDSKSSVRASSAIALSWIGPRAKAAVPALIRQIDDQEEEAFKSAITAIGRMGPSGKEAIPRLEALLSTRGTEVADALRLIGANPDSFVPTLIAKLPDHSAAIGLAQTGDAATPALLKSLHDQRADVRKMAAYAIANMAGWKKLTKNHEEVAEALIEHTNDANSDVVRHAIGAMGSLHAAPDHCIPVLVALLAHSDATIAETSAESLGEFGKEAKAALPALIECLGEGKAEFSIAFAIREIGIDQASAAPIAKKRVSKDAKWLLVPLTVYSEAATDFLRRNPNSVDVPKRDEDALLGLMRGSEPEFAEFRQLLFANEQLPLAIMARLGDSRFLPLIEQKQRTASAHEGIKLAACARACGAPADRVVIIDDSHPGDFKPKSAWPDHDDRRLNLNVLGHGDGFTEVIVTGRILKMDGTPAVAPKFYRTNDAMLLGRRVRDEEPITFDAKTGRFVLVSRVFAAYSMGKPPEPGPYQTGSSFIQIEAAGCKPLKVQFYDEMPEVQITLMAEE